MGKTLKEVFDAEARGVCRQAYICREGGEVVLVERCVDRSECELGRFPTVLLAQRYADKHGISVVP